MPHKVLAVKMKFHPVGQGLFSTGEIKVEKKQSISRWVVAAHQEIPIITLSSSFPNTKIRRAPGSAADIQ
ncbi:hypothetical protein [Collimonas fungivorans]|uniref:hypothetical protein n=1 Tax=Collimonas fungivorans TaxID=158899 RepID=UPI003FA376C0